MCYRMIFAKVYKRHVEQCIVGKKQQKIKEIIIFILNTKFEVFRFMTLYIG